jgi:hypothetical protein
MSDIFLLYNGQKKKIKAPETMSDLQSEFLKIFFEDKNKEFIYIYNDKGEEIDIEHCTNFNEIMDSIKSMEEPIIKIRKKEETLNLAVSEERVEKDENNSDELDPVRSGQVFTKPKKEEKNVKLESNNSETINSKIESPNVNIEIDNTEITKSIAKNNSKSNQTKKNNYETPRPDSDSDDDDDDENQTPTGDEKPRYHPNKNMAKPEKDVVKIEKKDKKVEETKENKEKCDSSKQKPPSQVITCSNSNSNSNTKSDKINQNIKGETTSTQNNNIKCENDSIEELKKKLKELEKFKEKSQENTRNMAKKNLELSKNLKKEKEENAKLKKKLNEKKASNGNEEELEKIKKEYESKMEESNKRIEEIENEKKIIENKYEEINKQFLEEKEKNKNLYEECKKIKLQIKEDSVHKKKEEEEENISLNCTKKEDEEKNKLKNKIKDYKEQLNQAKNIISKLQKDIKNHSNINSTNANIQLPPSSNSKLNSEEEVNIAREDKKKSENNRNDKSLHLSKIFKKKVKNSKEESSSRVFKGIIEQIKIQENNMKNKIIQKSKLKLSKIKNPKKNSPKKSDNKMKEKLSLFEKENSELKQEIEKLKIEINNKIDIINNLNNSNNNQNGDLGNQKQLIKEICEKIIKEKSEAFIKKELFTIENSMNKKIEKTTQDLKNNYSLKYNKFENEMKQKFFGEKNEENIPNHRNEVRRSENELFLFRSNRNSNTDNEVEDSIKKFSYECLNIINLSSYIYEGTDEVKMNIIMKNNCNIIWPEGDTKLVLDNDSKIPIDDIVLLPQKPEEQNTYEITIKNLSTYSPGEYISYMLFKADGQIFGDKLQIKIVVQAKKNNEEIEKNKDKINEFREMFSLDKVDYSDEKLLEILKSHDFDYEQAFSSLYD